MKSVDSSLYSFVFSGSGSGVLLVATTWSRTIAIHAGIPFFDTPKIGRKDDIRVLVPMITTNMWEASFRVTID